MLTSKKKFFAEKIESTFFYSYNDADNTSFNISIICNLIRDNNNSKYNKIILLQLASVLEVCFIQIFDRARYNVNEGVPDISVETCDKIREKNIDKFAVIIDSAKKYNILNGFDQKVYDDLHRLRKHRNKIHIQGRIDDEIEFEKEDNLYSDDYVIDSIEIGHKIISYFSEKYCRPENLRKYFRKFYVPNYGHKPRTVMSDKYITLE